MKGLQWPSCRCSSWNRRFLSSCSKWATGPLRWADNGWRSCQSEDEGDGVDIPLTSMVRDWKRKRSDVPALRKGKLRWTPGFSTLRQFSHAFQIRTYHGLRWKPSGCVRLRFCGVVWKALASALNREGLCPVSLERDQHHWVPQANSQAKQFKYLSWAKVVWSFAELIFWTKWCKVNINQSNTKSLATLPSTPQKQVNVILKLCIMKILFLGVVLWFFLRTKKTLHIPSPHQTKLPNILSLPNPNKSPIPPHAPKNGTYYIP